MVFLFHVANFFTKHRINYQNFLEGKRLVFTEQRQTSIYIDYPATRDGKLIL